MFTHKINDNLELALPRPAQDADALFKLVLKNKTEFSKWLPWVDKLQTAKDEEQFLKHGLVEFSNNQSLSTMILFKSKPVGMISLNRFHDADQSTEIGYWLDSDFSGQGIMHQAVLAICDIAFSDYSVNKVTIHASTKNKKSNHVAEKCGFHFDGVTRAGELLKDGFHDSNNWSLLKSEWQNKKQ